MNRRDDDVFEIEVDISLVYRDAFQACYNDFTVKYVEALIERAGGNIATAARLAGMDRSNFRKVVAVAKSIRAGEEGRLTKSAPRAKASGE